MPNTDQRQNQTRSVRGVRGAVRGAVRAQTRAIAGLCGMCGVTLTCTRVHAHSTNPTTHTNKISVHVAPTPHIPHIPVFMRVSARTAPRTTSRTPRTHAPQPVFYARDFLISCFPKKKEVEKMDKGLTKEGQGAASRQPVITCGPENIAGFNARLRAELPEFHAFAKALHARGLIDGLRGARIGPSGSLDGEGVIPNLTTAAEARLKARSKPQGGRQ